MNTTLCKDAGERIQKIRKEKGYTRESLAIKAGVSSKFIYEIERGTKRFSSVTLGQIAKVLEVSCDYILFGDENGANNTTELEEILSLFDNEQQQKLVPLLKLVYEMMN